MKFKFNLKPPVGFTNLDLPGVYGASTYIPDHLGVGGRQVKHGDIVEIHDAHTAKDYYYDEYVVKQKIAEVVA